MALTFDTLKFVKTLESAGMSPDQAEAISVAVRDAQASADVATKGDLREVELRLGAKMQLIQWMLGITLAGVGAMFVKLFWG